MITEHIGLKEISGSLIALEGVEGVANEEVVRIYTASGEERVGSVVELAGDKAVVQVFEGTSGISLKDTRLIFTARPMEMTLAPEMLGRVFSGAGKPRDGLGEIYSSARRDVNGSPINPVSREYPRNFIQTGISSIDAMSTLIRGQKLPIFSGAGMKHNELAAQIVRQAKLSSKSGKDEEFAVVFAAMGVKNDVAEYFRRSFESSGVL